MAQTEGAKFWLEVINDLRSRDTSCRRSSVGLRSAHSTKARGCICKGTSPTRSGDTRIAMRVAWLCGERSEIYCNVGSRVLTELTSR
jgi:hypothetical protein